MKSRLMLLTVLALLLPCLLSAYPAIGGGRGLLRTQSALVEDVAGLTIGFHALGRQAEFPQRTGQENTTGMVGDLVAPELSYAPIAMKYVGLELFGSWGGLIQLPKSDSVDGLDMGMHDLKAGAKLSIPILPVLKLGTAFSYTFRTRDSTRPWLDPDAIPVASDPNYAWKVLADLHLQDVLTSAPNLMFNLGKFSDATEYGLGLELAGRGFALFVEGVSTQPVGSTGIFDTDTGRFRLTPGVVFGNAHAVSLKAAYTFSFSDDGTNPDEVVLGFNVATGFGRRVPAQYGVIAGTVTDSKTGAPLAANISFPDNPKLAAVTTDPSNGVFRVERVPVGAVTVEVSAEGHQSQAVPIAVEENKLADYAFKLRPLIVFGVIAGVVTDAGTGQPLVATVEFPGSELTPVATDAASGGFRVDKVPLGIYTLTATAEDYLKGTLTVTVEEDKPATPKFALNPVPKEAMMAFTGKVSDKKTGNPLAATVSLPGSTFPSVTSDPSTGVFKTDLTAGSYAVKVEAEGYIVQTAAIVIEKDKPLVRDFELVKEGMSITLKGIYFDFNKATIKPESREALAGAAKILTDNPSIKVEIQGHTDNKGSDEYNLTLSDKRAWAVVNYLVQNFGIDVTRLTAKGYGEARPIATNDTDDGRALNRRVEFVIVGQTEQK